MKTQDIIDHLKSGHPINAKVVKEIIAALELSRKQDEELKRLLAMQSDLDLQGYEHIRDELQELRAKLAESEQRVKVLEDALRVLSSGVEMLSGAPLASGKKVFYPNTISRQRMQQIASKALDVPCQK